MKNAPEFVEVANLFPNDTQVDCEAVAYDSLGQISRERCSSSLRTITRWKIPAGQKENPLFADAFDILRLNGKDLEKKTFIERKAILKDFIAEIGYQTLRYLPYQLKNFQETFDNELEGVIVKRDVADN